MHGILTVRESAGCRRAMRLFFLRMIDPNTALLCAHLFGNIFGGGFDSTKQYFGIEPKTKVGLSKHQRRAQHCLVHT